MGTRRLTERFQLTGGVIDRTGPYPVVKGVLLCGQVSQNRRRYNRKAFEGDRVKRYDGRPVFLNHGDGRTARRYEDKIATVENSRHREDGMPIGDLAINKGHPYAEVFLDDVQHHPNVCGMSHVADCEAKRASDGWDDILEIVNVESVDVVIGAATTKGVFEQTGRSDSMSKIALRAIIERVRPKLKEQAAQKGARRWLLASEEEDYDGPDMGIEVPEAEPPEGETPEPEDELWSGFHAACVGFLEKYKDGELSADEACKEIGKYVKAHEKLIAGKGAEEEDEDEDEDETPKESAKKKKNKKQRTEQNQLRQPSALDSWEVLAECKAGGLDNPSPAILKALARTPDLSERKALIQESVAATKAGVKSPRSGGAAPMPVPTTKTTT